MVPEGLHPGGSPAWPRAIDSHLLDAPIRDLEFSLIDQHTAGFADLGRYGRLAWAANAHGNSNNPRDSTSVAKASMAKRRGGFAIERVLTATIFTIRDSKNGNSTIEAI